MSASEPLSLEDAVELWLELRARGERVDARAFVAAHPHLEPDLASAIHSIGALGAAAIDDASTATFDELALPGRIASYRVVREIGRGGMGVVLEAVEEPLGRRVALKVLPAELVASTAARARFRREAQLASRLDHSGIATVYGAGVEDDQPWIAMRFVEGRTLAQAIADARARGAACVKLDENGDARAADLRSVGRAIATCIAKVARALHEAHAQGVVHRDVKPSNVIVSSNGDPVLLDFGLAIGEDADGPALTRTGQTAGTPAYLAPELVAGERTRPDAQSDVYALGVTLYECLALRRPFEGATPAALYRAIDEGAAPDLRSASRAATRDLAVVAATAMERDPARRYESAQALAEDLEACASGRPIRARPVPIAGRVARWIAREPRLAAIAALALVATLASAVLVGNWWASRDEVRNAETVARDQEVERVLARGYSRLLTAADADGEFARALELDPSSLEALAGRALAAYGFRNRRDPARVLARAPATPGFDALRALTAGAPITQDAELVGREDAVALDFFLVAAALSFASHDAPLLERQNVSKRALAMANEAVVRSPHARSFFYVVRARVAADAGDERASRSACGALLALWPDSFVEVTTAGATLARFDAAEAKPVLERAVAMDPTDGPTLHELGNACRDLGDVEGYEAWMWRALRFVPVAEVHNSLGVSFAMRGCLDDALLAWQHALALDPRHADALLNTGIVALQQRRGADALFWFERLVEVDPDHPAGNAYDGFALQDAGRLEEARDRIARGIALDAQRPDYWTQLAMVQKSLGEIDAALATCEEGLARFPRYPGLVAAQRKITGGG